MSAPSPDAIRLPLAMLLTFRVLEISARRTLDFLIWQHASGQENGRLPAREPDLVDWGVARHDINRSLAQLVAVGLVDRIRDGAGSRPAHFALTWRVSPGDACEASNRWAEVAAQLADMDFAEVQRWLRAQPGCGGKPWRDRRPRAAAGQGADRP